MKTFFNTYQSELINSLIVLFAFFVAYIITTAIVRKIGKSKSKNKGRIKLVGRYISVILLIVACLVEAFILGVQLNDIVVLFSSIFAILGITLFANWSILSNVTSGIIMFFSFPYKIGDKIHIHDKDYEIIAIIEDIRSFQIHLRKDNGELVTYPNSLILQKAVSLLEKNAFDK